MTRQLAVNMFVGAVIAVRVTQVSLTHSDHPESRVSRARNAFWCLHLFHHQVLLTHSLTHVAAENTPFLKKNKTFCSLYKMSAESDSFQCTTSEES